MKKIFTIATTALLLSAGLAGAQEVKTMKKEAMSYLPQKGSFGLTADFTPFLTYLGHVFSDNGADAPLFYASNPFEITGMYFLSNKSSLNLSFTFGVSGTNIDSTNSAGTSLSETKTNQTVFGLGIGYISRRSSQRLMATYGPHLGVMFDSGSQLEYIDKVKANGTDNSFSTSGGGSTNFYIGGELGVEYFMVPKISIGGSVALDVSFRSTAQSEVTQGTNKTVLSGQQNSFGFRNSGFGKIGLNFYF